MEGINPREVQHRRDLLAYLGQSMSSEYRIVGPDGKYSQVSTYVKSYILECHHSGTDDLAIKWKRTFQEHSFRTDDTLLLLFDRSGEAYFADLQDDRFIVLHTISKTADTDKVIDRLTAQSSQNTDHAWFPTEFLLGTRRGHLRGFNCSHATAVRGIGESGQSSELQDASVSATRSLVAEHPEEPWDSDGEIIPQERDNRPASDVLSSPSRLSIRNSLTALDDYRTIRSHGIFKSRQALSWIQYVASNQVGDRITSGVYWDGKIIAHGSSIGIHMLSVHSIVEKYSRVIRSIEDKYSMAWTRIDQRHVLNGSPLLFRFPSNIPVYDLQAFVASIFNANRPFNLLGIPRFLSEQRVDVEAIDLHSGDPISFEITPHWCRAYLPAGSCANILARFLTNLQRWMNSDVILTDGEGELLFTEEDASAD